ncbi:MAG TPA: S8 family peptidase [Caulobacteraceae bacterium]|nr:S8 family peptidase [Caulobacteraceae bacterium]
MTPDPTSAEFLRNRGLAAIHADVPFNKGWSGQGVTVAVIDTGADPNLLDLQGALSPDSTDILPGRNQPVGVDDHASLVSTVIAARYNGVGTVGVAYKSTILSIRADDTTGSSCGTTCFFEDADTAAGLEYAIAHGAKVVNMSLGGDTPDSTAFVHALSDAVAAGLVVVASAGNDSATDPSWPARYASDPRFAGWVVAVGALNPTGSLASFSNQAGVSASGYIAAPGQNITAGCGTAGCFSVSGTSFSAPHVAGAVALLLQAFPNLTGRDAVNILFQTADDLGAPGVDSVYGHGALDLTHAFEPIGTMSVASASGQSVDTGPGTGGPVTQTGQAFGQGFGAHGELVTVGHDAYRRLYVVDLGASYRPGPGPGLVAFAPPVRAAASVVALPHGGRLAFAGEAPLAPPADIQKAAAGFFAETPSSATVALDLGRFGLTVWNGRGETTPPALSGPRDAYQEIAAPDRVVAGTWRLGRWAVDAEQGWAERREPFQPDALPGSHYLRAGLAWRSGDLAARFAFGRLDEPFGPLGSDFSGRPGLDTPARTDFVSASAEAPLGRFRAYAQGSLGRTSFAGQFLRVDGATSSAWRLGVVGDCGGRLCQTWTVELSQPLRVENGVVVADLAIVPAGYFDAPVFSERRFSAAASGREVRLGVFGDRDLGRWGAARLGFVAAREPGNIAGAPLAVGLLADWRLAF